MKIKKLTILLLLFTTLISYSQVRQHGLIIPNDFSEDNICCIYSPMEGFNVFIKPNGAKIGTLTRNVKSNTDDQSYYRLYFVDSKTNLETKINLNDFREIDYEIWSITFFET